MGKTVLDVVAVDVDEEYGNNKFWIGICYADRLRDFFSFVKDFLLENLNDRKRIEAVVAKAADIYKDYKRPKKVLANFQARAGKIPDNSRFAGEYKKLIEEVFVSGRF